MDRIQTGTVLVDLYRARCNCVPWHSPLLKKCGHLKTRRGSGQLLTVAREEERQNYRWSTFPGFAVTVLGVSCRSIAAFGGHSIQRGSSSLLCPGRDWVFILPRSRQPWLGDTVERLNSHLTSLCWTPCHYCKSAVTRACHIYLGVNETIIWQLAVNQVSGLSSVPAPLGPASIPQISEPSFQHKSMLVN